MTGFVLMIDEAVKVVNQFKGDGDYYSLLRRAMLDEVWRIFNNESYLNKCLVISSLELGPHGITESNRKIKPLPLPSTLNATEIVSRYWLKDYMNQMNSSSNSALRKRWELLAAITNSITRLVEIAGIAINKKVALNMMQNISSYIIPSLMPDIFAFIENEVRDRYGRPLSFPKNRELFHIVHSKEMEMTKYSMQLVENSIITNVVKTFLYDYKSSIHLTPESNIVMLALSARSVKSKGAREVSELYNSIKRAISKDNFSIEYMRGIFLGEIFLKMTKIRLLTHSEYPEV